MKTAEQKPKRLLSLDISTHTGWSVFEGDKLLEYGSYDVPIKSYKAEIKSFKDYPEAYPQNFMESAIAQAKAVENLLNKHVPDLVVIEETNKARQRFSQKALEWSHFTVVQLLLSRNQSFKYLTTTCWRKVVKCYLGDWPEYKQFNAKVSKAKRSSAPTKSGAMVAKIDGKIVSAICSKKLSVLLVNQKYNLNLPLSQDDICDSINLGRAAIELGLIK